MTKAARVGGGMALAALLALSLGCGAAPAPAPVTAQTPTAKPQPADTVRGTVLSISTEGGYCDVVAGLGYAVRMMRIHAVPSPTIAVLEAGDFVRVVYTKEGTRNVASSIQKVPRAP